MQPIPGRAVPQPEPQELSQQAAGTQIAQALDSQPHPAPVQQEQRTSAGQPEVVDMTSASDDEQAALPTKRPSFAVRPSAAEFVVYMLLLHSARYRTKLADLYRTWRARSAVTSCAWPDSGPKQLWQR